MLKFFTRALLLSAVSLAVLALDVANYPIYLNGPQQMRISILPLTQEPKALVQIQGVNHPVDKVVFLADIQDRGQGIEAYRIQYDGQPRALVLKGVRWGNEYYQAFLPDSGQDDIYLEMADNTGSFPDSAALLDRYRAQTEDGVQEKLARFDRAKHREAAEKLLSEKDVEANQACGTQITTKIDWQQIDDSLLQSISLGAYCGQVADEMARICNRMPEFKPDFAGLDSVQCLLGDSLKLRKLDQTLNFHTNRETPNQSEFVNSVLRNF